MAKMLLKLLPILPISFKNLLKKIKNNMKFKKSFLIKDTKEDLIWQNYIDKELKKMPENIVEICILVSMVSVGLKYFISRSQAKRLLSRLEVFEIVVLDFDAIDKIGHSFADEIFRVFQNKYPKIELKYINTNNDIEKIIKRAVV
ncbi:MAG: hypothetical protein DRQ51_07175 [Gammaproteobacteria bacterium]|nr:MAG: hypothetical protein DRQ51_07175 [Gammaproteobacteria bacterium]